MNYLKQGEAVVVKFGPFVSKADGLSLVMDIATDLDDGVTGIRISKNGAAATVREDPVTVSVYDSDGDYLVSLSANDVGEAGQLRISYSDPDVILPVWKDFNILSPSGYAMLEGSGGAGAALLSARVSYSSINPRKGYTEIIQGEEKVITFIVEADGRFDQAVPDDITVTFADPEGNVVTKSNATITRLAEELDIQVFRVSLDSTDTNTLVDGLAKIEIKVDTQKAYLTHSMKVVEAI